VVAQSHQDVLLLKELRECLEVIECFTIYGLNREAFIVLDNVVHCLSYSQHIQSSPEVTFPYQGLRLSVEDKYVQLAAQNK
jgi:hypothetical protein